MDYCLYGIHAQFYVRDGEFYRKFYSILNFKDLNNDISKIQY
jgi:hypothetical protein